MGASQPGFKLLSCLRLRCWPFLAEHPLRMNLSQRPLSMNPSQYQAGIPFPFIDWIPHGITTGCIQRNIANGDVLEQESNPQLEADNKLVSSHFSNRRTFSLG